MLHWTPLWYFIISGQNKSTSKQTYSYILICTQGLCIYEWILIGTPYYDIVNECNDVMLCFLRGITNIKVYLILPQIQKTVTPYYIFGPYNSLPGIHNQIIVCFHIRATYYTISVCTITSQT